MHKRFTNRSIQTYGYSPNLINEVFYLRQNHYNLCSFNAFATDNPRNKYLLSSSA